MKVTRILYSKKLTKTKYGKLNEIAKRLGKLRSEIWQVYGSIKGVMTNDREVRDQWVKEKRSFDVPGKLWKETLRDVFDDIQSYRAAAFVKLRKAIYKRYQTDEEREVNYSKLKNNEWVHDSYLRRMMRKYYKHGHTKVSNQIILNSDMYKSFVKNGQAWISVMSLEARKRIAIPLNTSECPSRTIRLISRAGKVEVHYSTDAKESCSTKTCGSKTVGVDKGYTEALIDNNGDKYGEGLGKILSNESDYLSEKYKNRNKLKALAQKKTHKATNIYNNNLGRKKLNNRKAKHTKRIKDFISKSVHKLIDKANVVASEDLTSVIKSKNKRTKKQKRRLSGWVKGLVADSLLNISLRRSATVVIVNAMYTSQIHYACGHFGKRKGDLFYCKHCGVEEQADYNAARNVLSRLYDSEINRWQTTETVKAILLGRISSSVGTAQPGHELHTEFC